MKLDKVKGDAHPFWGLAEDGRLKSWEYTGAPVVFGTKMEAVRFSLGEQKPVKVYLVVESE